MTIDALIAAWPDTESRGPILEQGESGHWWLCHADTAPWRGCSDGPYPSRRAAIEAHLAAVAGAKDTNGKAGA